MKKEYCNIGDDRSEISLGQGKDAAIHISSSGLQVTRQTSKPDNRRGIIEISRSGLCRQGQKIQRLRHGALSERMVSVCQLTHCSDFQTIQRVRRSYDMKRGQKLMKSLNCV